MSYDIAQFLKITFFNMATLTYDLDLHSINHHTKFGDIKSQ